MHTVRALNHLAALRSAAEVAGRRLDGIDIATDELDGNQLAVRGVAAARQLLAAVTSVGYRLQKGQDVEVQLPTVRLLKFIRIGGPALEGWEDHLASSLTIVILLDDNESVGYQVRVPGERTLMALHGTYETYPDAYKVAYQLFTDQGVAWIIVPDLFADDPIPTT